MAAWIVGHTDRFAAASANCPVIDWLSFVGTTDGANGYHNFEKLPCAAAMRVGDTQERRQRLTAVGLTRKRTP